MNAQAIGQQAGAPMPRDLRLPALRRFAFAITILNIIGRLFLGFEPSWAHMFAAMATAYTLETSFEWIDARANNRTPSFMLRGKIGFIDFLLAGHITALACSMLTYGGDRIYPAVFATTVGVCSKFIFRAPVGKGVRHFFNPSNTGIAVTILVFPWVGVAPPYQFSELLGSGGDLIIPFVFIIAGTFLNAKFTKKLPLIAGWLIVFALQAVVRHYIFGTWLEASLSTMTGLAFLLYTFYMVSDPATTPADPRRQFMFGASVAVVYGLLMAFHIVYGLFFSLMIVCGIRGIYLLASSAFAQAGATVGAPSMVPMGAGSESPALATAAVDSGRASD